MLAVAFACFTIGRTGQAIAQTSVDPQTVEFNPSADHSATTSNGQPLVERYDLAIYQAGAAQAYEVVSLGKPSADSNGKIRVGLAAVLSVWPLPLIAYEARVAAVGPVASAVSNLSNPFSFTGPCTYTAIASKQSFGSAGGSGTVGVTAGTGCPWSAGAEAVWAALASTGGTGSGTATFSVAPNDSALSRSTFLNVAYASIPITQVGLPCTFATSPASQSFPSSGGTGSVVLTTPNGCGWTTASSVAWMTPGAGGTGSKTVTYTVASNSTSLSRTGTLTVGGNPVTVTQSSSSCSYLLSSYNKTFTTDATSDRVSLSTQADCAWTATSNVAWVTVTTPSGSGGGDVSFKLSRNTKKVSRTGVLTIAGLQLIITQSQH